MHPLACAAGCRSHRRCRCNSWGRPQSGAGRPKPNGGRPSSETRDPPLGGLILLGLSLLRSSAGWLIMMQAQPGSHDQSFRDSSPFPTGTLGASSYNPSSPILSKGSVWKCFVEWPRRRRASEVPLCGWLCSLLQASDILSKGHGRLRLRARQAQPYVYSRLSLYYWCVYYFCSPIASCVFLPIYPCIIIVCIILVRIILVLQGDPYWHARLGPNTRQAIELGPHAKHCRWPSLLLRHNVRGKISS